jgi:hypothetical protein
MPRLSWRGTAGIEGSTEGMRMALLTSKEYLLLYVLMETEL